MKCEQQPLSLLKGLAHGLISDGNVYFSVIGTNTQTVSEEEVKNELGMSPFLVQCLRQI